MCYQYTLGLKCSACGLEETVGQDEYGRCLPYKNGRFDLCSGEGADVILIPKNRTSTTPGGVPQVVWEMQLCDTCMNEVGPLDQNLKKKGKSVTQQTAFKKPDKIQKSVHFWNADHNSSKQGVFVPQATNKPGVQKYKKKVSMAEPSSNQGDKIPGKTPERGKRPFGAGWLDTRIQDMAGPDAEMSDESITPDGDEKSKWAFRAARALKRVKKQVERRDEQEKQRLASIAVASKKPRKLEGSENA